MKLDRIPADLVRRYMDYLTAATFASRGQHDHRLPALVIEQFVEKGYATLPSHALAARFGATRRTICASRKRLEAAGFIRQTGINDRKQAVYVPCLERADEYRAHVDRLEHRHAA